jgi:hypothetical protein
MRRAFEPIFLNLNFFFSDNGTFEVGLRGVAFKFYQKVASSFIQ